MRGTLFFNPSSGAKFPQSESEDFRSAATDAGLEVIDLSDQIDVVQTIRERQARGVRLFVAAGGDGTINAVVQPLINSDSILGVIPVGTYNHFARDLDIPLPWREALEVVQRGETRQIDAARVNDRFFVNNLSLGLYPELVAIREARGRDYPRWKARLFAAYSTLRRYPHVTIAVESGSRREIIRTHVFMVSNNTYDLSQIGIEAQRNNLDEGRLSVYWLPHLPRIALTKFVARYLAGRVRQTPGFRSFFTLQMRVDSARPHLRVGIDGEVFPFDTPLVITTVPRSLSVKVPNESRATSPV